VILGALLKYKIGVLALDVPNYRSLHTYPTPKGGGVVIVGIVIVCSGTLIWFYPELGRVFSALGITAVMLGTVGWLDDHRNLRIRTKLLVECVVSVGVIWLIGPVQSVQLMGFEILGLSPFLVIPIAFLWLVWMTNLYNFMDGMDGLVTSQAIMSAIVIAGWFLLYGNIGIALFCFALAGAGVGFLVFNWSPASAFLGDVGSLTLGAVFGLLALYGITEHQMPVSAFLLLYGLFLADATITLIRRCLAGERWWEPHATHFYQRAARTGVNHARISILALAGSSCLAVLGTLETLGVEPGMLWLVLGLVLALLMIIGVRRLEQRSIF
jgi:Fuc2NAc and GlcNAc transferase